MKITLQSKNNYGNIQWYASDAAIRDAHKRLTGRTTFTDSDCKTYSDLGFEIVHTNQHHVTNAK